ncbi:unnamed protein product [Caenorhabditis sp. 36 PRJEB53466]|nr:unnamed protein product [Caenorhabditis sp. 36 PRJEB53466]
MYPRALVPSALNGSADAVRAAIDVLADDEAVLYDGQMVLAALTIVPQRAGEYRFNEKFSMRDKLRLTKNMEIKGDEVIVEDKGGAYVVSLLTVIRLPSLLDLTRERQRRKDFTKSERKMKKELIKREAEKKKSEKEERARSPCLPY